MGRFSKFLREVDLFIKRDDCKRPGVRKSTLGFDRKVVFLHADRAPALFGYHSLIDAVLAGEASYAKH